MGFFFNHSHFGNLKPRNVSILMRFPKGAREKIGGGKAAGDPHIILLLCSALQRNSGAIRVWEGANGVRNRRCLHLWAWAREDQFLYPT